MSKFSYGQFAIVEATASQSRSQLIAGANGPVKQNAAKAPHIVRRPSRIIASRSDSKSVPPRPNLPTQTSASTLSSSVSSSEQLPVPNLAASVMKGSVGLSSALSKTVLLRVKIAASADVHFTTTISVYVWRMVPSSCLPAPLTCTLQTSRRCCGGRSGCKTRPQTGFYASTT